MKQILSALKRLAISGCICLFLALFVGAGVAVAEEGLEAINWLYWENEYEYKTFHKGFFVGAWIMGTLVMAYHIKDPD